MRSIRTTLVAVLLGTALLAGCGLAVSVPPSSTTIPKGRGPVAPSPGVAAPGGTTPAPSTTSTTTDAPPKPVLPKQVPKWCGLDGCPTTTTVPVTIAPGSTVPQRIDVLPTEQCDALRTVVREGYALFDLRYETKTAPIIAQARKVFAAVRAYAALVEQPYLTLLVDRDQAAMEKLDSYGPDDGRKLIEFLLPKANELSLSIQRTINLGQCKDL